MSLTLPADAGEPMPADLVADAEVRDHKFPAGTRQVALRNTGTNTLWFSLDDGETWYDVACGTSWDDRVSMRGAIAARWLEFEIAPILAKLDLGCEVDGIAQRAVEAYKRQLAVRAETLSIDSEVPFVGTATLTARPQRQAFHIDRIFIPPEIAPLFLIDDISIGNISQFSQSGAVHAVLWIRFFGCSSLGHARVLERRMWS